MAGAVPLFAGCTTLWDGHGRASGKYHFACWPLSETRICSCGMARSDRWRVCSNSVLPPKSGQNCFGRSSPQINCVRGRRRTPSPPARITPHRCPRLLTRATRGITGSIGIAPALPASFGPVSKFGARVSSLGCLIGCSSVELGADRPLIRPIAYRLHRLEKFLRDAVCLRPKHDVVE